MSGFESDFYVCHKFAFFGGIIAFSLFAPTHWHYSKRISPPNQIICHTLRTFHQNVRNASHRPHYHHFHPDIILPRHFSHPPPILCPAADALYFWERLGASVYIPLLRRRLSRPRFSLPPPLLFDPKRPRCCVPPGRGLVCDLSDKARTQSAGEKANPISAAVATLMPTTKCAQSQTALGFHGRGGGR